MSEGLNPIFVLGWLGWRIVGLILFRMKIRGRKHIPRKGGFILACNHISFYDPPLLGCAVYRSVSFMAKEELFRNPIFGWIMRWSHSLPVRRGAIDRAALKNSIRVLKEGGGLMLFPEGTRSKTKDFLPPKAGVGMIALQAGCPIIPVHISGSNDLKGCLKWKKRTRITIGEPISPEWLSQLEPGKESYMAVAEKVMGRIAALRAEEEALLS
ncbi:MAG: lysophospholipid acyltransferase family protein [bacterium]|nr:lysophospholipid acyltransferase family protein [bacterium]